jgi:hypothetical protein
MSYNENNLEFGGRNDNAFGVNVHKPRVNNMSENTNKNDRIGSKTAPIDSEIVKLHILIFKKYFLELF